MAAGRHDLRRPARRADRALPHRHRARRRYRPGRARASRHDLLAAQGWARTSAALPRARLWLADGFGVVSWRRARTRCELPRAFRTGSISVLTQLLDYPATRRELPAVCDIRVRSGFSWYCSGARCTGRCRPGHAAVSGRRCDGRARSSAWRRTTQPWNYHSIFRFDRPTAGPRLLRGLWRSWLTCSLTGRIPGTGPLPGPERAPTWVG